MLGFQEIVFILLCVVLVIAWIIKNNLYPTTNEQSSGTEQLVSETIPCPRQRSSSFDCRIDVNDLASKKEFGNWVKCVLALNKTRKAILSPVAVNFKTFIESFDRDNFGVFRKCLKDNKVKHIRANAKVKKKRKWECSHNACAHIFKKLLAKHIPNLQDKWTVLNYSPSQRNSDEELQNSDDFWEIGRLFTFNEFELKENTYDAVDQLDIAQIIKLMRSCELFTCDDSVRIYEGILDKRNKLMHSVDNMTTDMELTETFSLLNELLTLFSNNSDCKNTIDDVKQFEKEDFSVNVTSSKFKIQDEEALELQVAALETDVSQCNYMNGTARNLEQKLSSTSELLKRIKAEVRGSAPSIKHNIYCQLCEKKDKEVKMAAFCEDCREYLCDTCLISHDSVNKNLGHLILRHHEDEPNTPSQGLSLSKRKDCKASPLVIKSHNRKVIGDMCLIEIFDTNRMLVARSSENVLLVITCNTESQTEIIFEYKLSDKLSDITTIAPGKAFALLFEIDPSILIIQLTDDKKSVKRERPIECKGVCRLIRYKYEKLFVLSSVTRNKIDVLSLHGELLGSICPDIHFKDFDVYNNHVFTVYEWGVKTLTMGGEVVNDKTLIMSLKNVSCTGSGHLLAWGSTNLCILTVDCQSVANFSIPNYLKGEVCKGRSSAYCLESSTLYCVSNGSIYNVKL